MLMSCLMYFKFFFEAYNFDDFLPNMQIRLILIDKKIKYYLRLWNQSWQDFILW
jgi:hypothetical protein